MQATKTPAFIVSLVIGMAAPASYSGQDPDVGASSKALFWIGKPDGSAREFGGGDRASTDAFAGLFPGPVEFTVGRDAPSSWPFIHPGSMDGWAWGKEHTFTIRFHVGAPPDSPSSLILGLTTYHPSPSRLEIVLNGTELATLRLPSGEGVEDSAQEGPTASFVFPIGAEAIRSGENSVSFTLRDGSWMVYDYLYLGPEREPPRLAREGDRLFARLRGGPMAGVEEFIFCARRVNEADWHWYANIGYCAYEVDRKNWREGTKLYRWNTVTGALVTLLADPQGGVRDPQVHYDGKKILFSYRRGGTENYLLHEIGIDGTGLRRLTDGIYDDIEPTYLPNGDIAFVSTRCKRWVNCWMAQVAVLYRADADGRDIRPISSNNEQDNTPWPLPDGRVLYTRWEYVDRSQVDYHHLWAANPDGTAQMVWYGNLLPGTVMIDAKPIPGSDRVVAVFSPGHGQREHSGLITIVDPKAGPDSPASAKPVSRGSQFCDPWAFSEDCFLAALGPSLVVLDGRGTQAEIFKLPAADLEAGMRLHEPRPLLPRRREPVIPDRIDRESPNGRVVLADIYDGRNMEGIERGEIKKLLVLETLPIPVHYSGGMEPISYGGTFTLERVLGTVPVEPDGSAYLEVPALRSVLLVALDDRDLAVKRMQSFFTVEPGETTGCVGCHEQRSRAPRGAQVSLPGLAMRRPPSRIEPVEDVPEVLDFPRDIQPILDRLCVSCHGYEKTAAGGPRAGRLILSGDRGPMYSHSYYALTVAGLFSDGRNKAQSNYAPRRLGSAASRILEFVDGSHHGVEASPLETKTLRLWIETGAAYPGTYASLGTGMIGGYLEEIQVDMDTDWPAARAAASTVSERCAPCHAEPGLQLPLNLSDEQGLALWQAELCERSPKSSRHLVYNLSRPEKSLIVLAPLAEAAGGWGLCRDPVTRKTADVFASTADPDYKRLLDLCVAGRDHLARIRRFDMPGFRPREDWVREMKRYGILPSDLDPAKGIDVYATERAYWRSLWYLPEYAIGKDGSR